MTTTRAVLTSHPAGSTANHGRCPGCRRAVSVVWRAGRAESRYVLAQIYVDEAGAITHAAGRWARQEAWHPSCYAAAGDPYGPTGPYRRPFTLVGTAPRRRRAARREVHA